MGAQGTTTVDFGAFPGASHATFTVTGQTSILSGSLVEAWIVPIATSDHSADEHILAPLRVFVSDVVAGTGFTGHVVNTWQQPQREPEQWDRTRLAGPAGKVRPNITDSVAFRCYGQYTVGWVWN